MSDFATTELHGTAPTGRHALRVRSRGRRFSTRIKTVATICAMGSWGLLVAIPVVAFLLTDFPHLG